MMSHGLEPIICRGFQKGYRQTRSKQNECDQSTASKKGQVTTTEGETIDADIVYYAAGFQFSGGAFIMIRMLRLFRRHS